MTPRRLSVCLTVLCVATATTLVLSIAEHWPRFVSALVGLAVATTALGLGGTILAEYLKRAVDEARADLKRAVDEARADLEVRVETARRDLREQTDKILHKAEEVLDEARATHASSDNASLRTENLIDKLARAITQYGDDRAVGAVLEDRRVTGGIVMNGGDGAKLRAVPPGRP